MEVRDVLVEPELFASKMEYARTEKTEAEHLGEFSPPNKKWNKNELEYLS